MMQSGSSYIKLILVAIVAVIAMSLVPVLVKSMTANEVTVGIVRLAIGFVGITLLMLFSKTIKRPEKKDFKWLVLLGVTFALHWYCYFVAIKQTDASVAAIGVATFGIHLLFLSAIFEKMTIRLADIIAVIIAFYGIYLVLPELDFKATKTIGFLIAILSGLFYACLPLINRKISHVSTSARASWQFGIALLCFLLLIPQANFDLPVVDWQNLVVLGVVSTLLAHTLWIKVTTELPSSFSAVIYYAYVPLAMILSYWIIDEPMTAQKIAGASLIIAANVMVVLLHKKG
ncbi:MAG: DMT family transporter [Gammaproteobacteria bacterium]|nr:DMT family transporter [Gammaproteobacteria bacterium]